MYNVYEMNAILHSSSNIAFISFCKSINHFSISEHFLNLRTKFENTNKFVKIEHFLKIWTFLKNRTFFKRRTFFKKKKKKNNKQKKKRKTKQKKKGKEMKIKKWLGTLVCAFARQFRRRLQRAGALAAVQRARVINVLSSPPLSVTPSSAAPSRALPRHPLPPLPRPRLLPPPFRHRHRHRPPSSLN